MGLSLNFLNIRTQPNRSELAKPRLGAPAYWSFNADAATGHAFSILMACSGTLRTSCFGAG